MDPEMLKRLMKLPKPVARKLFERINYRFHLEKENILKQAFEEDLFSKEEYNKKYKDMFYDDYGSDSFIQYINAVMNSEVDCFVTSNERMLGRKEELSGRFKLKIASAEEIVDKYENRPNNNSRR